MHAAVRSSSKQSCNALRFIFALTMDGRFVEINMNVNEALPAIIQIFDYDKPKPGVSVTRQAHHAARTLSVLGAPKSATSFVTFVAVTFLFYLEPCPLCL